MNPSSKCYRITNIGWFIIQVAQSQKHRLIFEEIDLPDTVGHTVEMWNVLVDIIARVMKNLFLHTTVPESPPMPAPTSRSFGRFSRGGHTMPARSTGRGRSDRRLSNWRVWRNCHGATECKTDSKKE